VDQFSVRLLGEFAVHHGDRRVDLPPACRRKCASSGSTTTATQKIDGRRLVVHVRIGPRFGRRNGVPGELVVRITPTKVHNAFGLTS
jgi:hypothetical protein